MNNKTCQIDFPWNGDLEVLGECEYITLHDIDVISGGTRRKKQIQQIQEHKNIFFITHESQIPQEVQEIYYQELLSTLNWLRPYSVYSGKDLDLIEEHKKRFFLIFPQTEKLLGFAASRLRDAYLAEMTWNSWYLQDHWRYFVGFLRQRFSQNQTMIEVAQWEWARAWLDTSEISENEVDQDFSDDRVVVVNPAIQFIKLAEDNNVLSRPQGLYALMYSQQNDIISDRRLDVSMAVLIDLLSEERRFTTKQLIELASVDIENKSLINIDKWGQVLKAMMIDEIIIASSE